MDLVTQDSYEKRHKQSTIAPALAKEKEIKEESIQKKQPRNKQKANKNTGKTPNQHRKTTTVDFEDNKIGHLYINARRKRQKAITATKWDTSRGKTNNTRKQRFNYLEETHSKEEESEPEEIQQITQINRVLPDKNDNYGSRLKINGKYQNFTIDTGSPITKMPNNPKLYNTKDIKPLKKDTRT